jgi:hypothetical protein
MIIFDLETLDTESTAVVFSLGAVYHDGISELSYQNLIDTGIFIKFDVREQIVDYKRTRNKSTLEWWSKQSVEARKASVVPSASDLDVKTGLGVLYKWFKTLPDYKNELIMARGILDQSCSESLARSAGLPPILPFASWRDIRTAMDFMYPKNRNGYVDVDTSIVPDYKRVNVIRHHPLHDSAEDACMVLGGVDSE